jgi:hypothetical protein
MDWWRGSSACRFGVRRKEELIQTKASPAKRTSRAMIIRERRRRENMEPIRGRFRRLSHQLVSGNAEGVDASGVLDGDDFVELTMDEKDRVGRLLDAVQRRDAERIEAGADPSRSGAFYINSCPVMLRA